MTQQQLRNAARRVLLDALKGGSRLMMSSEQDMAMKILQCPTVSEDL